MAKRFLDIGEQVALLRSRGVFIGNEENARRFLMCHGYYAVINGYKAPLLNRQKTKQAGEERYRSGIMFADFQALYRFDEMLRQSAREALDVAESVLKTSSVHAFCYYHRGLQDYLDPASYAKPCDYYDPENYTRNLIRLLGVLQKARDNAPFRKDYIRHHAERHGAVPLWVIAQVLTFGNMSAFFDLQKQKVQNAVCHNVEMATEKPRGSLGIKDLRKDYKVLTAYRNTCSHGERFYCAKVGLRGQYRFPDLVCSLKDALPPERFIDYITSLLEQLNAFSGRPEMKEVVLDGMCTTEQQLMDVLRR